MPFLFTEFFFLLVYFMQLFLRPNVFIKILINVISIYSLQMAMFSFFSDGSMDVGHFNEITGGCFALIIFGIGLFMILNSKKHVR